MRRLTTLFLLLLWLSLFVPTARAQSYSFRLVEETVHVYWNADGTLSLDYTFTFANDPGAHPIDFVDLGLPNDRYDFQSIAAWVNGQPAKVTRDYQGEGCCGVAIDLGANAIPAGKTGQVRVYVERIERMLRPDSSDDQYVSAVFSPTWFGSAYVHDATHLTVVYHFPPGMSAQEPRYHQKSGVPQIGTDSEGRVTYTWFNPEARGDTQYSFGASFPKKYVPASAYQISLWEELGATIKSFLEDFLGLGIIAFWCFILLFGIVSSIIGGARRKMQYLPPTIGVEGHGIKRGLTAVEAAILLEQPLEKVMTMILFSVVKKGAAQVISRDPLRIRVTDPLPPGLHEYERQFLAAMQLTNTAQQRKQLREMIVNLIRSVKEKMRGFSRRETVEYYRSIMQRAWEQVEAAETPQVKSELFAEALEWTMLDPNYDERTRRVFSGPVYVPSWWHRYDPSLPKTSYSGGTLSTSSGGGRSTVPGSSFAASVINSVQSFSSRILGGKGFAESVTRMTNPPPPPSASSRSGGGGCACACAGCACACAGGGR